MKRNRAAARKKNRESVLNDSTRNGAGSPQGSSSEEEISKRKRVIQQRKSFIEMDKRMREAEQEGGGETPVVAVRRHGGEKRKSENANISSCSSGGEKSNSDTENQRRKNKRIRRRLSKRLGLSVSRLSNHNISGMNLSYGNLSISASPAGSPASNRAPTDKKTLQEIYSTCSALFQAHKITPQNAFSLKLVECLDEIIQSDDFDRQNLPLLARTLEIGGKIYVCRVDCTHSHTIKLVTEIAQNRNDRAPAPDGGDDNHQDDGVPENGQEDNENNRGTKKAKTKKRSRFIEDNDAKLNTGFEDQSSKYATRRGSLKQKLHRNIDEELDFDYLSYFQKPGETHPVEREEEFEALSSEAALPDSHVNVDEMKIIPWLPFNTLAHWDPAKFDLWGVPLANNADPAELSDIHRPASAEPQTQKDNEFAYNPADRPDEYPQAEGDELAHESFVGHDGFGDDNFDELPPTQKIANGTQPISIENLRSLDDLRKFFSAIKSNQLIIKNKYGWAGPVFLKPQRTDFRRPAIKEEKKSRKAKIMVYLDYDEVNWKDPKNRYITADSSKTTLDQKALDKWSSNKTVTPYCNPQNFMGYDDDEEDFRSPFDFSDANDDFMGNVTRFFVDTNRNIFKLMEEEFKQGKAVLGRSVLGHPMLGGGFPDDDDPEPEFDIEAPRDYSDDSAGNILPTPDDGPGGALTDDCAAAGLNLSTMFPGTLGWDTNPMSAASEFESVKFCKQPKPIDMHALKRHIRRILIERLQLDEDGRPTSQDQTRLDLLSLITELMKRVNNKMAKHLSVAIVIVGLMHVVADNKLFMEGAGDNPFVVSRGLAWRHRDNIPFNVDRDSSYVRS